MTSLGLLALTLVPAAQYPNPKVLAEAAELVQAQPACVLDTRAKSFYTAGHVPGAVWVDVRAWDRAFNADPSPAAWAKRLGEAGIDPAQPVVVYGGDDVRDAARVWWILRYWGCDRVRLLNGGWSAWTAAGGATGTAEAKPAPKAVTLHPRAAALATKDQLMNALKRTPPQLVDARSKAEYCGESDTAKRNGMIPGAVNLEWTDTLDPKTKRFKSADELAQLLKERRIDVDRPAVTYCQSGGRAAVVALALELMGGKQVSNYYRSWAEWGNDPNTPVAKPEKR
jgi:thiosulfate/3-mercaptopyruvate sulfurtransferase